DRARYAPYDSANDASPLHSLEYARGRRARDHLRSPCFKGLHILDLLSVLDQPALDEYQGLRHTALVLLLHQLASPVADSQDAVLARLLRLDRLPVRVPGIHVEKECLDAKGVGAGEALRAHLIHGSPHYLAGPVAPGRAQLH